MIINSSVRTDVLRAKNKYTNDYNAQRTAYESEKAAYEKAHSGYDASVEKAIRRYLSPEIKRFDPAPTIAVKLNREYRDPAPNYCVTINYKSPKNNRSRYTPTTPSGDYGYATGISWKLEIFIRYKDGEAYVVKNPKINADYLESADYAMLDLIRKFFLKVDKLDWKQIFDDAYNNQPTRESFGTTGDPGAYITYTYDRQLDQYAIERTLGTDEWVLVKINRESSYDKWARSARHAGVHDEGWMKLNSMTKTYYFFNFINYDNTRREHGYVGTIKSRYSPEAMEFALSEEIKMNKDYFEVIKPVQYRTTEDLTKFVPPADEDDE